MSVEDRDIYTEKQRHHMKMKADIEVLLPQAKECLKLHELEEARKSRPLEIQREHGFANILISYF